MSVLGCEVGFSRRGVGSDLHVYFGGFVILGFLAMFSIFTCSSICNVHLEQVKWAIVWCELVIT